MLRRRVHHKAKDGTNGLGKSKHGTRGADTIIPVPPGTIIRYNFRSKYGVDHNFTALSHLLSSIRDEDGVLAGEVNHHGQRLMVAKGGRGGRGRLLMIFNRRL